MVTSTTTPVELALLERLRDMPEFRDLVRDIARQEAEKVSSGVERPEKFLTVKECCRALGCSKPSVYRLINGGVIPIIKVGRATRIPKRAFDEAVASGRTKKWGRI